MDLCESCLLDWLRVVLMPLAIVALGYVIKLCVDRRERERMLFGVATAWRVEVFREFTVRLNDIYCYFTYQGSWLEMSPDQATAGKRACDRIVYVNEFLWTEDFVKAYREFTTAAFAENQGPGRPFLFRANVARHRENPRWDESWSESFVSEDKRIRRCEFIPLYRRVLELAGRDVGVGRVRS